MENNAVVRINDVNRLFDDLSVSPPPSHYPSQPPIIRPSSMILNSNSNVNPSYITYDKINNDAIDKMFKNLKNINEFDKQIIITRFAKLYNDIKANALNITKTYNLSKTFIITTGIINPALLSINSNANSPNYYAFFWIIWLLQLFTSLVTSYIGFYKLDKRYFLYNTHKKKLEKEAWNYIELIDKYAVIDDSNFFELNSRETTHQSKSKLFLSKLEKINNQMLKIDFELENLEQENKRYKGNSSLLGYNEKDIGESPHTLSSQTQQPTMLPPSSFQPQQPQPVSLQTIPLQQIHEYSNANIDFDIEIDSDIDIEKQPSNSYLQRKQTIRYLQLEKEKLSLIRNLKKCVDSSILLHQQILSYSKDDNNSVKEMISELEKKETDFINLLVGLSKFREAVEVNNTLQEICNTLSEANLWNQHVEKIRQS